MQLGEHPSRIHTIGSPGIDAIKRLKLMDRDTIGREVGMALGERNMLVTFHPLTIEAGRSVNALDELFAALSTLDPEFRLFFTLANADAEGRALNARIKAFVSEPAEHHRGRVSRTTSLHQSDEPGRCSGRQLLQRSPAKRRRLTSLRVDIGDRQKGRERAASVFNTAPERNSIVAAISKALIRGRQPTVSPYGDGESSDVLRKRSQPSRISGTAQKGLLRYPARRAAP